MIEEAANNVSRVHHTSCTICEFTTSLVTSSVGRFCNVEVVGVVLVPQRQLTVSDRFDQ